MEQSQDRQISRQVLNLSWPILLEVTFTSLFGMVNMVVLGQYAGGLYPVDVNVSAVGLSNQPFFFILAVVQALGVGGTTLIARAYGARELHRLGRILKHNLMLGLALSTFFVASVLIFQKVMMDFLGADALTQEAGLIYYRLVMIGLWFNCLAALLSSSIRGVGETQIPMRINVIANAINVTLAFSLVNGYFGLPELGITGAGIATLVANVCSGLGLLFYISSGRSAIQVDWFKDWKLEASTFAAIFRFGIPSAGEQVLLRSSLILYTKIVASLGTVVMAAHQIALNILSFSITPGMALGIAASTLVGQSLGARDVVLADAYGRKTARFGLYFGLAMSAVFFLGRDVLGQIYTQQADVVSLVAIPLVCMAILTPFQLVQLVQVGALRGVGDTLFPMLSTGFSVFCIRVCLSYILVNYANWGLAGAWIAVIGDQTIRSFLITWRYRQGKWKTIQV